MLVLGISGGIDRIHTNKVAISHDSAAVLLKDGRVVAAFEEERLNRIKHTNKFPANAIRACLDTAGVTLSEIDRFAVNYTEASARNDLVFFLLRGRPVSALLGLEPGADTSPRVLLNALLERELGQRLPEERFWFVRHHMAHAMSAFVPSGFERALVMTMDGEGEDESGYVATADERGIEILRATPVRHSLGLFYTYLTLFLGFKHHDEYKVMGLAPYGDPAVYRAAFRNLYTLKEHGEYDIHVEKIISFVTQVRPRQRTEPFTQQYKDIAAALQDSLEDIAFHVLGHFRQTTGRTDLCIAGGVGHNCTLNGKILSSGLFSRVFVQPASHDAGCALGAALCASCDGIPGPASKRGQVMPDLFTGTDVGDDTQIEQRLRRWAPLISIHQSSNVARSAAELLAQQRVIGWVQGRSEFGPRALGNRSILADPRPAENKEIINAMVKKREGFRPFAPAVLVERARDYFEVPEAAADLGHMTYVLSVRPERRAELGAITHVDGSARVQTVERATNARFWDAIAAFGEVTGIPVVLNTSFNNNAEPIVDSVDDAVVCFLTTKLNAMVVGDFVIEKAELSYAHGKSLALGLCAHVSLQRVRSLDDDGVRRQHLVLGNSHDSKTVPLSPALFAMLDAADGTRSVEDLAREAAVDGAAAWDELVELWSSRLVTMLPAARSSLHA